MNHSRAYITSRDLNKINTTENIPQNFNKLIIIVFNLTKVDQQISLILVTTVLDVVINLITKNNFVTDRLGCVSHHTVRSKFIFHQRFSINIKAVEIIQNEGNVMKRRL